MISLRPLCRSDFPLLRRWLDAPHVARWWNHVTTDEALEADFGPSIDGVDPARLSIGEAAGRPFGYIQSYRYSDNLEYLAELQPIVATPPEALSIDYFVGETAMLRQGWGTALIRAGALAIWRDEPDAPSVIVPVNAANVASRRVLVRAGFVAVASGLLEPDNPVDGPEHVVYRIDRP